MDVNDETVYLCATCGTFSHGLPEKVSCASCGNPVRTQYIRLCDASESMIANALPALILRVVRLELTLRQKSESNKS